MADLVGAVASPLVQCGKVVYRNTKSFFKLQSNLSSLQHSTRVLKEMEDDVKHQIEAADREGRSATAQVKEWLRQVGEILVSANQMEPGMISGCLLSCRICRKVRKTLEQVERLTDTCPHERVAPTNRAPPTAEHIPAPSIEDQTTAAQNLNQVLDLLNEDQIQSIGIWGMGGVGKTTLAKNLNNKLQSGGSHFGMVIWVTVSKDFNMKMVQSQIADRLGLPVGDRDEGRMAVKLHARLMRENIFMLILDDVWNPIDLDRLGIPKPQVHRGVKIVLTSRSLRVCQEMKTDTQVLVQVMDDKEAWKLFVETVGEVANFEQIKAIAEQVCQQCCGLPLAIAIVGAAMRGIDMIPLWKDTLSELQRSVPFSNNIEEQVFKPLKWSYDKLQGNHVKSCFLYCCLYPEDFSIRVSELVKCWVGEGLIDEELNHEQSLNRGIALIQNLKESCLLETGEGIGTVKMHDVVRDVAIWISSHYLEDGSKFLVRAGIGLTQLSLVKFTTNIKRISFMYNQIDRLPSDACSMECSNASTMFLQGNHFLAEIPDWFPQKFPALQVLNLSDTNISSMSPTLMQLTNITTLVLRGCGHLEKLPTLGWDGLKRMQVLDLSETDITSLPRGMRMLVQLRELNLSKIRKLKSISAGVFSMLSCLEILDMSGTWYVWGLKEVVEDGEAHLEELGSLGRLHRLFIQLKPNSTLSWIINPTWVQRLTRFQFLIAAMGDEGSRSVVDKDIIMDGINTAEEERTEYLLSTTKATSLSFYGCEGLDKLVQNMGLNSTDCFSALKSLNIVSAKINLTVVTGAKHDLLPNLEDLYLYSVSGMRSISELSGHLGLTFSKLQRLSVYSCDEMKYLLSVGHHLLLEGLQELKIWDCVELEDVFVHGSSDSYGLVPRIKDVDLSNLPELRTLCNSNRLETWTSLKQIQVLRCGKLRKLPISSQNHSIRKLRGERAWWNNLEWDDPTVKASLQTDPSILVMLINT